MLKRNYLYIIASVCLFIALSQLQGCKKEEIPVYHHTNCLFFDRFDSNKVRIDTAVYSFSNYPNSDEITHKFKISLIGAILGEDKEYQVKVVDGMDANKMPYTTAKPDQYKLSDRLIFRKGVTSDSLNVVMIKEKLNADEEVYLTIRLVPNDNFGLGYYDYIDVKLRFNNRIEKPVWWDAEITASVFGDYSLKKLGVIMTANPGFTTPVGMSLTEKTKIGLATRAYIREHNITEEDGSKMRIPIY